MIPLLENSSFMDIVKLKFKFFISRALLYASFLLIPVWIPRLLELGPFLKISVLYTYTLFLVNQWFLLGKELDHRFKIFFKVNSSLDRLTYRVLMGMFFYTFYFGLIGFLSPDLLKHFFWGTWILFGLYYSWPTRGKIIEETLSGQLLGFRFLDPLEKLLLTLIIIFVFISLPNPPQFEDSEALRLILDPHEKIFTLFWNFLHVSYFPFRKVMALQRIAWTVHFYLVGMGTFLLVFYSFARFFFSRRSALLGIFSIVSSWPIYKLLESDISILLTNSFSLVWIWAILWSVKSSTYRMGLFLGYVIAFFSMINLHYLFFLPFQFVLVNFFLSESTTPWFRRQFAKYTLFGVVCSFPALLFSKSSESVQFAWDNMLFGWESLVTLFPQKSFYALAIVGVILLVMHLFKKRSVLGDFPIDKWPLRMSGMLFPIVLLLGVFIEKTLVGSISVIWIFVFLGLIVVDFISHSLNNLNSRRNVIYIIYILVNLLDSHFEGRVKNFFDLIL